MDTEKKKKVKSTHNRFRPRRRKGQKGTEKNFILVRGLKIDGPGRQIDKNFGVKLRTENRKL